MRFIILMHGRVDAWTQEEHAEAIQESVEICRELHEQGRFVSAAPLQPPEQTRCVQVQDGETIVTDGAFSETKEVLGGYFLVEAESLEEAVKIAARLPGARRGTAEVRPLMDVQGLPTNALAK